MKTLIEHPKLRIDSTEDGVWLHFSTADGQHSSINLPAFFDGAGLIRDKAIRQWAKEYAISIKS